MSGFQQSDTHAKGYRADVMEQVGSSLFDTPIPTQGSLLTTFGSDRLVAWDLLQVVRQSQFTQRYGCRAARYSGLR
jgi:hypothetical protein